MRDPLPGVSNFPEMQAIVESVDTTRQIMGMLQSDACSSGGKGTLPELHYSRETERVTEVVRS